MMAAALAGEEHGGKSNVLLLCHSRESGNDGGVSYAQVSTTMPWNRFRMRDVVGRVEKPFENQNVLV